MLSFYIQSCGRDRWCRKKIFHHVYPLLAAESLCHGGGITLASQFWETVVTMTTNYAEHGFICLRGRKISMQHKIKKSKQEVNTGADKWSQCRSALKLHFSSWPAGGDYEKMSRLLTWFVSSVYWFQRLLWSQFLVSCLLQHSMMFIL